MPLSPRHSRLQVGVEAGMTWPRPRTRSSETTFLMKRRKCRTTKQTIRISRASQCPTSLTSTHGAISPQDNNNRIPEPGLKDPLVRLKRELFSPVDSLTAHIRRVSNSMASRGIIINKTGQKSPMMLMGMMLSHLTLRQMRGKLTDCLTTKGKTRASLSSKSKMKLQVQSNRQTY